MTILKKVFSILARIGISILLLWFVFRQVDERMMLSIIKSANKGLLLLACVIYANVYLLCLLRWQVLLKAVDMDIPFHRILISFSGGVFFSLFLPSTIGGDFMRSIDLAAYSHKPRQVVATVFVDRLSGYIGMVILSVLALGFGWNLLRLHSSILISIMALIFILVFILIVLFNHVVYSHLNRLLQSPTAGRIRVFLTNLHREIHYFVNRKKAVALSVIFSLLVQIIAPLTFFIVAVALGVKLQIIYFLIFLPIIGAVTMLPISIGGLGVRDALTVFFFAQVGMGKDLAFAMSLVSFLFILFYGAVGGIIYVLTIHHRRLQPDQ